MKAAFLRNTNFSGSDRDEDEEAPPIYSLERIKIEEDFVVQKAPLGIWSATSSSIDARLKYNFVFKEPVDYIDYKLRYLVLKEGEN
jgi:hypothetical protein